MGVIVRSPGLVARVHQVLDVAVGSDGQLGQVLHVGSHQRVLSHAQVPLVLGVQQVTHALAVDFHVAHLFRDNTGPTVINARCSCFCIFVSFFKSIFPTILFEPKGCVIMCA